MNRRRPVQESLARVIELEQQYHGWPQETRLRWLRFLAEDPRRTIEEGAALAGVSRRSASRWWSEYMAGGIDAMLKPPANGRGSSRIDPETISILRRKVCAGELVELAEIRDWIVRECEVTYTPFGIRRLLRQEIEQGRERRALAQRELQPPPAGDAEARDRPGDRDHGKAEPEAIPIDNQRIVEILNELPASVSLLDGIDGLKRVLGKLLPDVDRITVSVNTNCHLIDPDGYHPDLSLDQKPVAGREMEEGVTVQGSFLEQSPSVRLIERLQRQGNPVHLYHPPYAVDLYYEKVAYLGTLLFWRSAETTPIGPETIALIESIEPFLQFALSNLVTRHHYFNPRERIFYDALRELIVECELSQQEQRVLIYRLLGYSYKSIAQELQVAVDSVKKHLAAVYRKSGTKGNTELFAKYFTSRILVPALPQKGN